MPASTEKEVHFSLLSSTNDEDPKISPPTIAADDATSGKKPEINDDLELSTPTSLSSSIRDFKFENDRRYHEYKQGQYHFPNDESEQQRENMKHHMIVALCGNKLHNAPLSDPRKVLDIGTGTGMWAIEIMNHAMFLRLWLLTFGSG